MSNRQEMENGTIIGYCSAALMLKDMRRFWIHPLDIRACHSASLASQWDGVALFIDSAPINLAAIQGSAFTRFGGWLAIVLAIVAIRHFWKRNNDDLQVPEWLRRSPWSYQSVCVIAIVLCATTVGWSRARFARDGILYDKKFLTEVKELYRFDILPSVGYDEVRKMTQSGRGIIIDARVAEDFAGSHISGAINIPPNATSDVVAERLQGVAKTTVLVVYCQSESCPFSKQVAKRMAKLGFNNLALYRGGWAEWSKKATER